MDEQLYERLDALIDVLNRIEKRLARIGEQPVRSLRRLLALRS